MAKRKKKRTIINQPDHKSRWGYKDVPFQQYDEAVLIPRVNSVAVNELKKIIRVGKTYRVKPQFLDKKQKAKLVAIYSDPIGFGNKGKNTDVRLKTEWKFLDPIGSFPAGKHETFEDINIDFHLRSEKRAKIQSKLWRKHGMSGDKNLEELKKLIKQKKLSRF